MCIRVIYPRRVCSICMHAPIDAKNVFHFFYVADNACVDEIFFWYNFCRSHSHLFTHIFALFLCIWHSTTRDAKELGQWCTECMKCCDCIYAKKRRRRWNVLDSSSAIFLFCLSLIFFVVVVVCIWKRKKDSTLLLFSLLFFLKQHKIGTKKILKQT